MTGEVKQKMKGYDWFAAFKCRSSEHLLFLFLCAEVLDELIETLIREDPKLRNGRRKMTFDKIVEKVGSECQCPLDTFINITISQRWINFSGLNITS